MLALIAVAVAVFASESGAATMSTWAQPLSHHLTPLSLVKSAEAFDAANVFPEQGRFTSGEMNNATHLQLNPHTFEVTGPCDILAINPNNANDVSLIRDNRRGEYEVTCGQSDAPSQRHLSPLSKFCIWSYQVDCKTMNYEPEMAVIRQAALGATGLAGTRQGGLIGVVSNVNRAKQTGTAQLSFGRIAGAPHALKQITITQTGPGTVRLTKQWYGRRAPRGQSGDTSLGM